MKRSFLGGLACVGALAALLVPTGTGAVAGDAGAPPPAADHVVQVGAIGPPGLPYSYTRYYPSTVEVHRGQTVEWHVPTGPASVDTQFHTVTFSPPADPVQPGWFRPDEAPDTFALNEPAFNGTGCGRGDEPDCVLRDTSQFFSSGTPADAAFAKADGTMRPFRVHVDAPAGAYQYRCLIHDGMTGSVHVVPDDQPLTNPSAAEIAGEVAADTASADALYATASLQRPPVLENGRRVWTVNAGARTADRHVELLGYFPGTATIAPGDEIRYVGVEPHTVTFPVSIVGPTLGPTPIPFGSGAAPFVPSCDPDDPAAGAPGVAFFPVASACPAGTSFELMVPPWMTEQQRAPADVVATPATVHNSGFLVPSTAPESHRGLPKDSGRHFPSEFRAVFPLSGSYPFGCSLHAAIGMRGGVNVR